MRRAGLTGPIVVLALCAVSVHGSNLATELSLAERHALTPIDTVVTTEALNSVLQAPDLGKRIARLQEIAESTEDLGVRLRAIRALPHYCTTSCRSDGVATGDPAHLAVRKVFQSLDPTDHGGKALLRLRSTLEALGATRSGLTQDVNLIAPFLDYASRDIRVTAARALGDLCNSTGLVPLRARYQQEQIEQVRLAISTALRDLGQCGQ
jgi:hypothetical protein